MAGEGTHISDVTDSIMKEDLCDHVWDFRFKKEVPEYWLNLDPSWNGTGPPMRPYFHVDGSHSADPDDQVWGGHECSFKIITSFVGEGKIGELCVGINRWPHMTVARKHDWSWTLTKRLYCYSMWYVASMWYVESPIQYARILNVRKGPG